MTYHKTLREMVEMFMDKTAGETYSSNRLVTREEQNGNVSLIGYGWLKLAEYDESRNLVKVFTGHEALQSKTVKKWTNKVVNIANDRDRAIILSGESPTTDKPNEGVKYIDNYVSMDGSHSPVEADVVEEVEGSLEHVA